MKIPRNHPGSSSNGKTQSPHPTSIRNVFKNLARYPGRYFVQQWNWKSALMSALVRGLIFFAVNGCCNQRHDGRRLIPYNCRRLIRSFNPGVPACGAVLESRCMYNDTASRSKPHHGIHHTPLPGNGTSWVEHTLFRMLHRLYSHI